ncbi:MAG TPA: bifunctional hydroxymethylpyrimidine kinase/phosphomethylpyrimidine kinase [Nitrososphaeraceae archaeon]|nr:bifunctional hydroxymethylpyrimidine kinase/phosphomethylpyrimidine kinase [Nitrososphaeraceae archaeon]
MRSVVCALSIAGSDSGGGAGIQADIQTMAALGIYPCTVITAITAQNTSRVNHITPVNSHSIREQIESVFSDIPLRAIKIGMVYNKEIISVISRHLIKSETPVVLDPVLAAGTGAKLLLEKYLENFKSKLIPLAVVITPNVNEAQKLSGIKIRNESDITEAAIKIKELGAKNVIVKGGHFNDSKHVVDILIDVNNKVTRISNARIDVSETHGSGCNFSAALTSFIARKFTISSSCIMANKYVHESLSNVINLGRGLPVNAPLFSMYENACRYRTVTDLTSAVTQLTRIHRFREFIPETQSNMVYALPYAKKFHEVAGVDGRIVRLIDGFRPGGVVKFGASKHVASAVLSYMKFNPLMRSAINIRFDEAILDFCKSLYSTAEYFRDQEPVKLKQVEGRTISWGVQNALLDNPESEIIYHKGDFKKEPMILVFGQHPLELIVKIREIIKRY